MTNPNNAAQAVDQEIEAIMEANLRAPVAGRQSWPRAGKLEIECDPDRFGVAFQWHITDGFHHAIGATPNEALNRFYHHIANAPVAGEAQGVSVERLAKDPFLAAQLWRNPVDRAPVAGEAQPVIHQHGFASDNQKLRAINESLDEQLEEVMAERDDYHDWADELSEAIAAHLGVEIGEHSSSNLPWLRALDAIKNAAPQASEAVRMEDLKAIAREVAADSAAIRAEARNAALEEAAKLMDQTSRSSGAALIRAQASAPVAGEADKRWPFVESPGAFADRLASALEMFGGNTLAAVRHVLIERPAVLAAPQACAALVEIRLPHGTPISGWLELPWRDDG